MDEAEIQSQFVRWLAGRDGYEEVFIDPNGGAGALVDSIGLVAGRAVLIEFKRRVSASTVRYSQKSPSSIERKIRNALIDLFAGRILDGWARDTVPLVYVVAESIPISASVALRELLEERSQEWHFQYEFGQWDGTGFRSLAAGPLDSVAVVEWSNVVFPEMRWPGEKREPRRTLTELRQVAADRGVGALFDEMLVQARRLGLTVSCNRENLILRGRSTAKRRVCAVASIWPRDSGKDGLCVGTSVEGAAGVFEAEPAPLPGVAAAASGYLGERRFLRSSDQVAQYWTALSGKSVRPAVPGPPPAGTR